MIPAMVPTIDQQQEHPVAREKFGYRDQDLGHQRQGGVVLLEDGRDLRHHVAHQEKHDRAADAHHDYRIGQRAADLGVELGLTFAVVRQPIEHGLRARRPPRPRAPSRYTGRRKFRDEPASASASEVPSRTRSRTCESMRLVTGRVDWSARAPSASTSCTPAPSSALSWRVSSESSVAGIRRPNVGSQSRRLRLGAASSSVRSRWERCRARAACRAPCVRCPRRRRRLPSGRWRTIRDRRKQASLMKSSCARAV